MLSYPAIKAIHVGAVALSIGLFALRGLWMALDSPRLQARYSRILPHVIDTVLLLSAGALCVLTRQYPFVDNWLTAKVVGLLVYIGLGTVALKRGATKSIRLLAFVAAVLTVAWIVATARAHSPWP